MLPTSLPYRLSTWKTYLRRYVRVCYTFSMTTTRPEPLIWTIAYRKPTGPWFQRVDLELTWHQAVQAARSLNMVRPDLVVYYTTNRQHDDATLVRYAATQSDLDRSYAEDAFNILVDSGKRVAVKDSGKLDPRVCITPAAVARRVWDTDPRVIRF